MGITMQTETHKSKIGGQALFEGVMMRGPACEAMAVRKKDGTIHLETKELPPNRWYQKTPFIRGSFNFVIQMRNGYKYMMKSMEICGFLDEDEEELRKIEERKKAKKAKKSKKSKEIQGENEVEGSGENAELQSENDVIYFNNADCPKVQTETQAIDKPKKDGKAEAAIGVIGMVLGVVIAIGLFMYVPTLGATYAVGLLNSEVDSYHALFAGLIRIILFVAYMWAISLMKDIRTTYEYHGAEHKTITAYEAGERLDPENVENVKKYTRLHPRCGTSFIFLVLVISILLYSILPIRPTRIADYFGVSMFAANIMNTGIKLLLMPFLVGITYEVIKLAGRHDRNIIMRAISAPGLALQRLTTCEPTDRQLQVAITAMLPVIPDKLEDDKW